MISPALLEELRTYLGPERPGQLVKATPGQNSNVHRRHLLCLLSRFLEFSRVKDQGNVCPLSRPVMLSVWLTQPVSTSLQRGIRFFSFRTPAALWIRLAAFLPYAGNVTGIILLPSE
jgi:hypothetical protein